MAFVAVIPAYKNSKEELKADIANIRVYYGRRIGIVVHLIHIIIVRISIIIGVFSLLI